jgi:hypothetical protein
MTSDEYKVQFTEEDTPGWTAINDRLSTIYGDREPDIHYATIIKASLGGNDPLDGISVYHSSKGGVPHLHYVSYGFSNLYYDLEAAGGEFSGWGFELTFRLIPTEETDEFPKWPCSLLQNLARYVFQSKKWFDEYHWVPANGPIKLESDTNITGIFFCVDPELGTIQTPHGEVKFLQMVGVTDQEITAIKDGNLAVEDLLEELSKRNPYVPTDLTRTE